MILCDYQGYIKIFDVKGAIGPFMKEEPSSSVLVPVYQGSDLLFPNPLVSELGRDKSAFCHNKLFLF